MGDGEAPLGWSVVLRHACSRCHLRFCDLADRIPPPLDYTQLPCMTSSQPFCTNTARSQQHHSNISVSFPPGNLPSLSRCLSCASKTERSNTCEAEYCFPLVVPHAHTHISKFHFGTTIISYPCMISSHVCILLSRHGDLTNCTMALFALPNEKKKQIKNDEVMMKSWMFSTVFCKIAMFTQGQFLTYRSSSEVPIDCWVEICSLSPKIDVQCYTLRIIDNTYNPMQILRCRRVD